MTTAATAQRRRGERVGWTFGWLGGFIWVAALAGVFLWQGRWLEGALGLLLTAGAAAAILRFAPWRHPTQPYWKLLLAPYTLFMTAIAWAVWAYGGPAAVGLDVWMLVWLVPLLIPFGPGSRRTWAERDPSRSRDP